MESGIISFETLYSDYIKRMNAFVSTFRGLGGAEIENLAHDILVHAWFKKDRYDGSRPLNAWIYALARNYVIDYLRSRKIVSVPFEEDTLDGVAFSAGTSCAGGTQGADGELIGLIKQEIQAMNARDRQIAMLIFLENMTGAETARIMEMPGATVRWRLAAIRKRLQKICREAR